MLVGANKIESHLLFLFPYNHHPVNIQDLSSLAKMPFPYRHQRFATNLSFADSEAAALTGRCNRVLFFFFLNGHLEGYH